MDFRNVKVFTGWKDLVNKVPDQGVENAINQCCSTHLNWCGRRGYDYEILTDEFFIIIPQDEYDQLKSLPECHPGTLADLARLYWIEKYLDEGYDNVVWLDADLVVYPHFEVNFDYTFSTLREMWVTYVKSRDPQFKLSNSGLYSNGVVMFSQEGRDRLYHWISFIRESIESKTLPNWYYFSSPYFLKYPLTSEEGFIPGLVAIRKNVAQLIVREGESAYDRYYKEVDKAWKEVTNDRAAFANLSPNASLKFLDKFVSTVVNYKPVLD